MNYWCSFFILPEREIEQIEQKCAAFFWKGSIVHAKRAKVYWNKVGLPMKQGGLGLKKLLEWNNACFLRYDLEHFLEDQLLANGLDENHKLKGKLFWSLKGYF